VNETPCPVSLLRTSGAFDTMHTAISLNERLQRMPRLSTSNKRVNAWLKRSEADLRMLTDGKPRGTISLRGVHWFATVFGRDGLITRARMFMDRAAHRQKCLAISSRQPGHRGSCEQDAEPGKILHENAARRNGRPQGSAFWPLLWQCRFHSTFYYSRGGLFSAHRRPPVSRRAFGPIFKPRFVGSTFMATVTTMEFVEYARRSGHGLVQQGWKDFE